MNPIAVPLIAAMIATSTHAQDLNPVPLPGYNGGYGASLTRPTGAPRQLGIPRLESAPLLVPASAETKSSSCFDVETDNVVLRGAIVQSVFTEADDLSGRPAGTKYLAIALDQPICFDCSPNETRTLLEIEVAKKWLGHHVVILGDVIEEGGFIDVHTIKAISDAVTETAPDPAPTNADFKSQPCRAAYF